MDKALKISIIIGITILSLSIGYYLVLKPSQQPVQSQKTEFEACYQQCSSDFKNGMFANGASKSVCISICGPQN
jgi:uncharacterized protein YpmB